MKDKIWKETFSKKLHAISQYPPTSLWVMKRDVRDMKRDVRDMKRDVRDMKRDVRDVQRDLSNKYEKRSVQRNYTQSVNIRRLVSEL